MRLYNTLTRREEEFVPSRDNLVRMYACGLTVYARGHIGNFRTFVAVDVLRRALKYQAGFDVRQVMNFTDVDDRTILESQKAGVPLREYTDRFIAAFREDAAALGLEAGRGAPAGDRSARTSRRWPTRSRRSNRTATPTSSDGSIYFKIATFPGYGKLAHLDHSGIKSGARIDSDKYEKDDARDFVLWKATKAGEPTWDPGIGPGRPGLAHRVLGDGAAAAGRAADRHPCRRRRPDLPAPRERDRAERRARPAPQFSRFWFHVEHLMIDMSPEDEDAARARRRCPSRSATSTTSQDIVERGFRPSALRYLYLGVHYRKQLQLLVDRHGAGGGSAEAADRLPRAARDAAGARSEPVGGGEARRGAPRPSRAHVTADVNTAAAIGVMFELVRALNSAIDAGELGASDAGAVRAAFDRFDRVLGVLALRRAEDERPPVPVDGDRGADRGAQGRPAGAQLRRGRSHPHGSRGARDHARGHRLDDAVEEEVLTGSDRGRIRTRGTVDRVTIGMAMGLMDAPDIKTPLPGPKAKAIIDRDRQFVSPSYTRDYPFVIARGEGAVVEDVDGNRFLDCAAGIAVNSTGVSHPDVVAAIVEQARKFIHMSGTDFYYEPQVRLAEELARIVPIDGEVRTFFANSGTETTEAAIKLARYHTKRQGIIAFIGGFHGRSLGALSLTASKAIQRRGFGPFMPGVYHAPYPDTYRYDGSADRCAAECLAFITDKILVHLVSPDEIGAIVVEPIQGEGGYIVPPKAFLQGLRELATRHGMVLVVDEVQSGMGRTGKMFASEHFDLKPDVVNIAKGIASGLPLGVTCARADIMTWPPGAHASTFGGNPVACAAANATIALLKDRSSPTPPPSGRT